MKAEGQQRFGERKYLATVILVTIMLSLIILAVRIQQGIVGIVLLIFAALISFYLMKNLRSIFKEHGQRDFIYEVIEEDGSLTVIAQVPGPEECVKTLLLGRKVIIEGGGGFKRTLILRSRAKLIKSIYKNGVLTIKLEKI